VNLFGGPAADSVAAMPSWAICILTRVQVPTVKSEWVPSGQGALKEPGGVVFREGSYTAGFRHGNRLRGRQP
jgi:hypothetical protein